MVQDRAHGNVRINTTIDHLIWNSFIHYCVRPYWWPSSVCWWWIVPIIGLFARVNLLLDRRWIEEEHECIASGCECKSTFVLVLAELYIEPLNLFTCILCCWMHFATKMYKWSNLLKLVSSFEVNISTADITIAFQFLNSIFFPYRVHWVQFQFYSKSASTMITSRSQLPVGVRVVRWLFELPNSSESLIVSGGKLSWNGKHSDR